MQNVCMFIYNNTIISIFFIKINYIYIYDADCTYQKTAFCDSAGTHPAPGISQQTSPHKKQRQVMPEYSCIRAMSLPAAAFAPKVFLPSANMLSVS